MITISKTLCRLSRVLTHGQTDGHPEDSMWTCAAFTANGPKM